MPFPPTFTNAWDTTFPPDTQLANLLGSDLRQVRVDVMQRMSLLSGTFANRPTPETVNATWGGAGFGLVYISIDTKQIFQWNGAAWVDISASVPGGISITAVDLTAQGGNIGATTILTPAANGYFRISGYLVVTQAASTSSVTPNITITFTDADSGVASQNILITLINTNTPGSANPGSTTFEAKSGVAIKYQATGYSSTGGIPMQYALHMRLEGPF